MVTHTRAILLILVFVCIGKIPSAFGQSNPEILQQLQVDVVFLASDLLEGRPTGGQGEALAAQYLIHRMKEIGLTPGGEAGKWLQEFEFSMNSNPHAAPTEGKKMIGHNVLGMLDFGAPSTIIIGAHFDHLGYGGPGSLFSGKPTIHNGADDNASGVAALLRLAQYLKEGSARNNNYLFIAFSGEEYGLYGSKHVAANPPLPLTSVNYMLNMDMVGRLRDERVLAINGTGTSPIWKEVLNDIQVDSIQIKTSDSGVGPSDHTSFYLKDLPVLHFFTGQHTDYHKPSDDSENINYEGLYSVTNFIIELIEKLDAKEKLTFTKTKDESQTKVSSFKVSLGVMPDYVNNGDGMRVDAVLEGRAGEKAGLKNGDIIIQMGDMKIKDIYGYMEALGKFKKGETTTMIVKREGKEVELTVTF